MKKLINKVEDIVTEMIDGIVAASPNELKRVAGFNVVARKNRGDKVGLVSGGGSGHEPAHAGFVGYGMLDAAVAGEVFTSPTPDQILAGIKAADAGKGVLLVIKNYTGDVLNFDMAGDLAKDEGISIAKVVVADDIAVQNSTYTVGRRGIAGTVFVHKIAGSAAESGMSLADVHAIAEKTAANVRTLGMSLGPAIVPASGKPSFELGPDEVEIGLGIHGEPGTHREKLRPAKEHVKYMLDLLLAEHRSKAGDDYAVLVNGLGATPLMELFIINHNLQAMLKEKQLKVHKTLVGNYMTSMEMPGFSISLLKLDETLKKYLDFPIKKTLF